MVMVTIDKGQFYMDKTLKQNIDVSLDAMEENDDLVFVIDGPERSGKSFLARQIGKYCAAWFGTKFDNDNVHFKLQDYVDFSIDAPMYSVIVLDEARNVLNRKSAMSKTNKKFTNYISECAKKRQVHIICIPAFHDLDKYITLWRMKFVINVKKWFEVDETKKSGFKLARGQYKLHLNDNYLKDSYNYPYKYPLRWETKGEFRAFEVFTDLELKRYEDKKDENMELKYHSRCVELELSKREQTWKTRSLKLISHCELSRGLSRGEMADALGMEVNTLNKAISYGEDKGG